MSIRVNSSGLRGLSWLPLSVSSISRGNASMAFCWVASQPAISDMREASVAAGGAGHHCEPARARAHRATVARCREG
jgi:hypothetical protein